MIDYDKLKNNMNNLEIETLKQIISFINDSKCWDLRIRHNGKFKTFQVDFLKHFFREINIEELNQPKPKYEVGDEVYFIVDNEVECMDILEIVNSSCGRFYIGEKYNSSFDLYSGSNWEIFEDEIYPSKESLIEAQIDMWMKLKDELC